MGPKIRNQQNCTGKYLAFSRTAVNRLQKLDFSGMAVAFISLLRLLAFALVQRQTGLREARIATSQSLVKKLISMS